MFKYVLRKEGVRSRLRIGEKIVRRGRQGGAVVDYSSGIIKNWMGSVPGGRIKWAELFKSKL